MPTAMPIFQQIMIDIRARIASGDLRAGDKLPSARTLATQYGCSVDPVRKALGFLKHEGLLIGHAGRDVRVTAQAAAQDPTT
jgi:GntR family transcriptional regulator